MEKMEVKNTAGIIIYAIKNNLYKAGTMYNVIAAYTFLLTSISCLQLIRIRITEK